MIATEIKRSNSWQEFKNNLKKLSSKEKGDAFEHLVMLYFQIYPRYATILSNIWLCSEIPTNIKKKLNLPDRDMGIDLITQTKEGEYWAIQCKYKSDETRSLTWKEISTFTGLAFGTCRNISFGLVCTTADRYAKLLTKQDNIGFLAGDVWRNLNEEFFIAVRAKLLKKRPRITPLKPYPHQRRAIQNAHNHYIKEGATRGK